MDETSIVDIASLEAHLQTQQERLDTFYDDWKCEASSVTPAILSENGFYYTGKKDAVSCFRCGITLINWVKYDTVEKEHYNKSRECPFARQRFLEKTKINPSYTPCKICTESKYQLVAFPICGHVACSACGVKLKTCYYCRADIPFLLPIFL
jgi:Inhibitor of Apoptosis domain/Zinc finger, C3HC4 type (RING finger)